MVSTSDILRLAVRKTLLVCAGIAMFFLMPVSAISQAENVSVTHPVYDFLKRMEVKEEIEKYHDAILPLSRRQVVGFLWSLEKKRERLTNAEQSYLARYSSEFVYELSDSARISNSLVNEEGFHVGRYAAGFTDDRQKFFYTLADSNVTFFFNGLLNFEGRGITGDALGKSNAEYVQFGGRFRGTIISRLGYYLEGKNASFWGSRELLQRDRLISQAYTLGVTNTRNFDFIEGYARYDGNIISAQVGRERLLWGNGFDQKMILSENVRGFDFVRADVEYKSLKYTFLHAWILGKKSYQLLAPPADALEPVVADKYFAAHRLELSFPGMFDIGGQEMVIYSNRSPDLAYLNPFTVIESAQRSREERDNVFWAFDIQTRFIPAIELSATFLLDDLNFPDLFTNVWSNRWAGQASLFYADPFMLQNTSLIIEYTRVAPYVFSHNRSRDNDYGSLGVLLGPRIQPNSDCWFFRFDVLPHRNFTASVRVALERHGANEVDASGVLLRNVGGDFLQPHRDKDANRTPFLDGIQMKTIRFQFMCTYEFMRQTWADLVIENETMRNVSQGTDKKNTTYAGRIRFEL